MAEGTTLPMSRREAQRSVERRLSSWLSGLGPGLPELFLVGGAMRDIILGRATKDIDLACRGASAAAALLAAPRNAAIVPMEKAPDEPCYRVVVRSDPGDFLDVAELRGRTIEEDLGRRDFTMNALAARVAPDGSLGPVIDPHGGTPDIGRRLVRAVAPRSFPSDPLRLLRAVRFAAAFDFGIDPDTERQMRSHAGLIAGVAAERIAGELLRILHTAGSAAWVARMDAFCVLSVVFPEIEAMRDCTQNDFHDKDVWGHALVVLHNCELILARLEEHFGHCSLRIEENLSRGRRRELLKLAALFHDAGKPAARADDEATGRIHFQGHDREGVAIMDGIAARLRLSAEDRRYLTTLVAEHMHVLNLAADEIRPPARLRWFRKMGDDAVPAIILGMADIMGILGPASTEEMRNRHLRWSQHAVRDYYASMKKKLEEPPLIAGKDLIGLGLEPGPKMGALLARLREAQEEGRLTNRDEALSMAKSLLTAPPADDAEHRQ